MGFLINDFGLHHTEHTRKSTLPYQVEPTTSGKKYILPYRDLSEVTTYGWLLVGIGVLGTAFMLAWISGPAVAGLGLIINGEFFGAILLAFASFGLIGLWVTVTMLAAGVAIVRNQSRCEIEIRGRRIYSREVFGWFNWRRKFDIKNIQRLELQQASNFRDSENREQSSFAFLENLYGINAIGKQAKNKRDGDAFLIAPGYEKELIESLANDLSQEMSKDSELTNGASRRNDARSNDKTANIESFQQIPVSIAVVDETEFELSPEKPLDSKIEMVNMDGSNAFQVPPQGLAKGSAGLFGGSILWLGIVGFIAAVSLLADDGPDEPLFFGLIISLFALIGVAMLVASINMARRSVMLGILDDQLVIERKTLFGTKWIELPRSNIMDIRIGPSGTEINDVPIMQLQIHTFAGKKHGLLSQLGDDEIRWLASELKSELSLDKSSKLVTQHENSESDTNWPDPPAGCDIRLESLTVNESIIMVPSLGLSTGWGALLVGNIMIAAAFSTIVFARPDFGAIGFILIFALVGALFLTSCIVYYRRSYHFHATRDNLVVTRSGLLGRKTFQWPAKNISNIQMTSNGHANGKPIMQLSILNGNKTLLTSLSSRPPREILYVAAHLKQTLGLDNDEV